MDGKAAALVLGLCLLLLLLVPLRRSLGKLLALGGKTLAALGSLALLKVVGGAVGVSLGVNLANALVLALLGAPGLGLLLLLDWVGKL